MPWKFQGFLISMMKRYKVYLLDFDGTLIDSIEGLKTFYNAVFGSFGYPINDEETYLFSKMSLEAAFNYKHLDPSLTTKFRKKCEEVVESKILLKYNKLYEDTLPLINYIKDNNLSNGIVTGNSTPHVNYVFENLGIKPFYHTIISGETMKKQKPEPEGIFQALEALNYQGDLKEVAYIGDAYNDYLCAKNAGVTPIIIDRHHNFNYEGDYIKINSLLELIK